MSTFTTNNVEVVDAPDNASLTYIKVRLFDQFLFGMIDIDATLFAISSRIIDKNSW